MTYFYNCKELDVAETKDKLLMRFKLGLTVWSQIRAVYRCCKKKKKKKKKKKIKRRVSYNK